MKKNKEAHPTPQEKKFIRETLQVLQDGLYLNVWWFDIEYMSDAMVETPMAVASCHPQHKYFTVTIRMYPLFWKQSKEEQTMTLVHEACHILTEPYKDMWERMSNGHLVTNKEECIINEQLTTIIERLATHSLEGRLAKV